MVRTFQLNLLFRSFTVLDVDGGNNLVTVHVAPGSY